MIAFKKHTLANGLTIITHTDKSTPVIVLNLLYKVGSKHEDENLTGFAHLFEHLMFGGSQNIPVFDEPLQQAGGENNAFTSTDITNYYITVPAVNAETAFWLESDRMLRLAFDPQSLETQRSVVIEEFKQRYLNQPYGDVWLLLRPLVYKTHSYKWATIGKNIQHIENAEMPQVQDFFYKWYTPANAVLTIAGDITHEHALSLATKWFAEIPAAPAPEAHILPEPEQREPRTLTVHRNVPASVIYIAFKSVSRCAPQYPAYDIITDLLAGSKSGRLYVSLVKKLAIATDVKAYLSGEYDEGMLLIEARLREESNIQQVENAIWQQLHELKTNPPANDELEGVKNKIQTVFASSRISLLDRAMQLSIYESMGDAELINTEQDKYLHVTAQEVMNAAQQIFTPEHSNTLYYLKND